MQQMHLLTSPKCVFTTLFHFFSIALFSRPSLDNFCFSFSLTIFLSIQVSICIFPSHPLSVCVCLSSLLSLSPVFYFRNHVIVHDSLKMCYVYNHTCNHNESLINKIKNQIKIKSINPLYFLLPSLSLSLSHSASYYLSDTSSLFPIRFPALSISLLSFFI